jgi:Glutathione S-transferase, N-terminal domain
MLTLYDFGNSVCCQKVRITMRVKGLTWDTVKVDLFRAEQYNPKYLKLNPKGIVPTLVHDGKPVIESTLISNISTKPSRSRGLSLPIRGNERVCACGARWLMRDCSKV